MRLVSLNVLVMNMKALTCLLNGRGEMDLIHLNQNCNLDVIT